ncbi:amidohydrolase family protein [Streptomyces sp. NPDC006668]|jgi:6-methylsalicylate decarboxylase|uniref:amidohydrolase family protein n=1 Tax=Streptomyces sp. NPDC006668 TaxID=3156903 RepID=UPI00340996B9
MRMARNRIDVHHHVIPPVYLQSLKEAGVDNPIAGVDYPRWTADSDLEVMDRYGIQTAILSITAPGVGFTGGQSAARIARQTNEFMAELIEKYPTRYGGFALIPLPDVDAALAEIDYALGSLGLDGVGLFTHYQSTYLGDPEFDPVFAELVNRGAVAFVHPTIPPAADQPGFDLPPSLYEFPFETTRVAANLLYSGTLDRYPDLKLILSHAGGAVPYLAQRLTYASTIAASVASREPKDLIGSLRRLYYDTAMSANPHTLSGLSSFIGTERILFGSDFPFMPESTTAETVSGLDSFFNDEALADINRNNAVALFPRLSKIQGDAAVPSSADHSRTSS